jgi:hypothetical protein
VGECMFVGLGDVQYFGDLRSRSKEDGNPRVANEAAVTSSQDMS